ncbi:hypothetical protein AVEN_217750-1 [Araneus ventricosus]|uniref:Uncharacterized protein n=1 Tax=Araneus ventricosus TaxID=182803 RepID=A0A4Y2JDQ8_ARAVE|nr:hypothetical protein AVEN_217750-1 [Araneus ventricosus]
MLVDEREHIRDFDYRSMLKARQIVPKKKTVRNSVPPKINFQASDCIEIINWNSCEVYLLRDLSEDDITSLINSDTTPIKEIKSFPVTPRLWKGASNLCHRPRIKYADLKLQMAISEQH